MDKDYERNTNENMYAWIQRIAPALKEMPLFEMQATLYDMAMDCYLHGSKEAIKNKRIR